MTRSKPTYSVTQCHERVHSKVGLDQTDELLLSCRSESINFLANLLIRVNIGSHQILPSYAIWKYIFDLFKVYNERNT